MYRASKALEKLIEKICLCGTTELQEETIRNWIKIHVRDIKKCSFPYRSIEAWNKLDAEVINSRNIHNFKSKLDNSIFGGGTVQA